MASVRVDSFDFDGLVVMRLYGTVQGDKDKADKTAQRRGIPHDIQQEAENIIKRHDPESAAKARGMGHNNEIYVDTKTGKVWLRGVRGKGKRVITDVHERDLPDYVRDMIPRRKIGFTASPSAYEVLRRIAAGSLITDFEFSRRIEYVLELMKDHEGVDRNYIQVVPRSELIELATNFLPMTAEILHDRELLRRFELHQVYFHKEEDRSRLMVHAAAHGDEALLTVAVDDPSGEFQFDM
ncbi:hypothetical protein [Burkholderia thailandensis]|uniref:hypothetical protein n=1 Tax=Burkholderia thailandensis TaxID=57975 RepID=UPI00016A8EF1|nr:hypothetical protein [Burkholderia thailandensis]